MLNQSTMKLAVLLLILTICRVTEAKKEEVVKLQSFVMRHLMGGKGMKMGKKGYWNEGCDNSSDGEEQQASSENATTTKPPEFQQEGGASNRPAPPRGPRTPTVSPLPIPSAVPTIVANVLPLTTTPAPSKFPVQVPSSITGTPTDASDAPTGVPSDTPSDSPSDSPSNVSSDSPSDIPSTSPTSSPTIIQGQSSSGSSDIPSLTPSDAPSSVPSDAPSSIPSDFPSQAPSKVPTAVSLGSDYPSVVPSHWKPVQQPLMPSDGFAYCGTGGGEGVDNKILIVLYMYQLQMVSGGNRTAATDSIEIAVQEVVTDTLCTPSSGRRHLSTTVAISPAPEDVPTATCGPDCYIIAGRTSLLVSGTNDTSIYCTTLQTIYDLVQSGSLDYIPGVDNVTNWGVFDKLSSVCGDSSAQPPGTVAISQNTDGSYATSRGAAAAYALASGAVLFTLVVLAGRAWKQRSGSSQGGNIEEDTTEAIHPDNKVVRTVQTDNMTADADSHLENESILTSSTTTLCPTMTYEGDSFRVMPGDGAAHPSRMFGFEVADDLEEEEDPLLFPAPAHCA